MSPTGEMRLDEERELIVDASDAGSLERRVLERLTLAPGAHTAAQDGTIALHVDGDTSLVDGRMRPESGDHPAAHRRSELWIGREHRDIP
jgi:hypothetical protein